MSLKEVSGTLMVNVIEEAKSYEKRRVGIQVHCRSFRSNATVSTFLPDLESRARASLRNSAALFFRRPPALVTRRSGLPCVVTIRVWPGCSDLTSDGEWKNSRIVSVFIRLTLTLDT